MTTQDRIGLVLFSVLAIYALLKAFKYKLTIHLQENAEFYVPLLLIGLPLCCIGFILHTLWPRR